MSYYAVTVEKLIDEFRKMPGVGSKSAQRFAFYVLGLDKEKAEKFASAIIEAKEKIVYCSECCNLTDENPCSVCNNQRRDRSIICVVESPADVVALEKTREYKGLYHVLHGVISPMEGIKPDDIKIKELVKRLANDEVKEVILATNPSVEGEATASYIARLVSGFGIKITRIAKGIPIGSDIEYADEITLLKAIENRTQII